MAKRGAQRARRGSLPQINVGDRFPKCVVVGPGYVDHRGQRHILVRCLTCEDPVDRDVVYGWGFVRNGGTSCYVCGAHLARRDGEH
ncbi:MAG: hypothetical protein BVN29_18325 [Nitrospira sp. ST-bin5]|nr:MAG: hypothetical protein BVN29_18325 [Nitrospira sp. ST-bin5]